MRRIMSMDRIVGLRRPHHLFTARQLEMIALSAFPFIPMVFQQRYMHVPSVNYRQKDNPSRTSFMAYIAIIPLTRMNRRRLRLPREQSSNLQVVLQIRCDAGLRYHVVRHLLLFTFSKNSVSSRSLVRFVASMPLSSILQSTIHGRIRAAYHD